MKNTKLVFNYFVAVLCFLLVSSPSTDAKETTSTTKTKTSIKSKELKNKNPLSLSMSLNSSTNLYEVGSDSHSTESSLSLSPSYALKNGNTVSLSTSLVKPLDGSNEVTLSNTSLALSFKSKAITEKIDLSGGLAATLPTNETDRLNNTFLGSLGLNSSASLSFKMLQLKSRANYSVALTKNFHSYTQNNMLSANTSHTVNQSVSLGTDLSKNISLSMSGSYTMAFTYLDNFKSLFGLSQTLIFSLPRNSSLSVTHSNGGSALGANGRDQNISFFNNKTSSLSMSLSWVL